ncbi:uncharacterized protein LOC119628424 [Bombyx mori]|uniref:Uncharacterized protein n=1 Tax=Bombyx mori TaxID=7091 RepID=A0A8R2LU50_BOMMO|nr:uncharacterized protein LOC119628424 isoform X2 [Bombyx mori]
MTCENPNKCYAAMLDSKSNSGSVSSAALRDKAASDPSCAPQNVTEAQIKPQISAPSYFYSLKENEALPFKRPEKEPRPKLLLNSVVNENDVVAMIAAHDANRTEGLKKHIGKLLVEKQIVVNYNLSERKFVTNLLCETIDYAAQRDFSAFKLACLLTTYVTVHSYFKWYYWQAPVSVWMYFKELMIRLTIEDSPDGEAIFEPDECYDILSHFHTMYIKNLPLIHVLTFGVRRLKFLWPFKRK